MSKKTADKAPSSLHYTDDERQFANDIKTKNENERTWNRSKKIIAGTIGAAVLGGLGTAAYALNTSPEVKESVVKLNEEPEPITSKETSSPEPEVKVEMPEINPVSVEEYPTPEKAVYAIHDLRTEYLNLPAKYAEDMDTLTSLENIYIQAIYGGDLHTLFEERHPTFMMDDSLMRSFIDYNEAMKNDGLSDENGDPYVFTFDSKVSEVVSVSGNAVSIRMENTSNIDDMPEEYQYATMPSESNSGGISTYILEKSDGNWHIIDGYSSED